MRLTEADATAEKLRHGRSLCRLPYRFREHEHAPRQLSRSPSSFARRVARRRHLRSSDDRKAHLKALRLKFASSGTFVGEPNRARVGRFMNIRGAIDHYRRVCYADDYRVQCTATECIFFDI
jgi:hypothetical protein